MKLQLTMCLTLVLAACGAASPSPAESQRSLRPGEISSVVEGVAERATGAVVRVHVLGYAPVQGAAATATSLIARHRRTGSGVIISEDGYIVTNNHVIAGAARVWVDLPPSTSRQEDRRSILGAPSERVDATVVGTDAETDIALLRIDRTGLPTLSFGDSDDLRPGQVVLALGSPMGLDGSVSMGVVSAVARQVRPDSPMVFVQTDAAINPGSSGGPLVAFDGHVVGINTFIASRSGGNEGLAFAVPSNIASSVVDQLRTDGRVRRGLLGVHAQTITPAMAEAFGLPQRWGVVIGDVHPRGPAASAGLETGDIVLSMNGKLMENARQFDVNVYQRRVGDQVQLTVRRGQETREVSVEVVERPNDPLRFANLADPRENAIGRLGIIGIDLTPTLARMVPGLRSDSGVVVAVASGDGLLRPGDVITQVNGSEVSNLAGLRSMVSEVDEGEPLAVQIERAGMHMFVVVDGE